MHIFQNGELLTKNIRKHTSYMDVHCNAGVMSTNMISDLPGFGTIWYHPAMEIANIPSLSHVKEHYRVTYGSHDGNKFTANKPDRSSPGYATDRNLTVQQ
jgi:hypothetical protein